jgi:hypothetical protein
MNEGLLPSAGARLRRGGVLDRLAQEVRAVAGRFSEIIKK